MRVATAILCAGLTLAVAGQEPPVPDYRHLPGFQFPAEFWTDPDFHPVGYLNAHPGAKPDATLPQADEEALARLFRAAGYAVRFKYRQAYPLRTNIPLYRLLRGIHPRLAEREGEGGAIIMTDAIVSFLEGPEAVRRKKQGQSVGRGGGLPDA